MARVTKMPTKAERDFQILVDEVYLRWDNPVGTRATVERRMLKDFGNPDKMAVWEMAARSKKWSVV